MENFKQRAIPRFSLITNQIVKGAVIVLITLSVFAGCKKHTYIISGTAPYNELHGIINDRKTVNEITLVNDRNSNAPKLRFPADIPVGVYTAISANLIDAANPPSEIRKGYATKAQIGMGFTKNKRLVPLIPGGPERVLSEKENLGNVGIHFIASLGPYTVEKTEAYLHEIATQSIRTTDKVEWGLREYIPTIAGQQQGFIYVPLDTNFRSIDGVRIYFGCGNAGAVTNRSPASCATNFNDIQGLAVTYNFQPELLPYWRELHSEVIRVSHSFLVQ